MKNFDEKMYEFRRLGFWGNFGRFWLLLEVNGMKICWNKMCLNTTS